MAEKPTAPSPNAISSLQSPEARVGVPTGLEPGQGYTLGRAPGGAPQGAGDHPIDSKVSFLVSFLIHALGIVALGLSALLAPKRPSTVPIFELVSLEKPKLRPLKPKTLKPPEPPPPEPEPVKPPEAPKLTTKPDKAVVTKKPDPKVVKERDPEPVKEKEVVEEQQQIQPQIVAHVPSDPRLSQWAARVQKKAEVLWNPPTGIDILGTVKTVISFTVTRDGTVQEAAVATGSGNNDLDELALRTIQRMERVPPIPENYPEDLVQVSYEFNYNNAQ